MRGLAGTGAIAFAVLAVCGSAGAATINVNTTADDFGVGATCSLREAVQAANANAAYGGCNGDTAGADTIVLSAGSSYNIRGTFNADDNNVYGDLDVKGQTTIVSPGGLATIDADGPNASSGNKDRAIQVFSSAGSVTLQNLRIQNGRVASGTSAVGGGGILADAPLTIIDSEITGNRVDVNGVATFGGGIYVRGPLGTLTMSGSTVASNVAQGVGNQSIGGGIALYGGSPSLTITNSTISGNNANGTSASPGGYSAFVGGIFSGDQITPVPATITNATITGNSATNYGSVTGGIEMLAGTVTGSIIAGNTDPGGFFPDCIYGGTSGGGNVIGIGDNGDCNYSAANDIVGTNASPINPNLGLLLPNGGLTRTHAPNPGSPAINRGGSCLPTDQRGLFRAPAAPCDAGAFEVGATTSLPLPPATATPAAAATGLRAAALAKCKKKRGKARKKCKRKAQLLPL
jgi:CSLREA domain-containing protein